MVMVSVLTVTYLLAGLYFGFLANKLIDNRTRGEKFTALELMPAFGWMFNRKSKLRGEKPDLRYPLVQAACTVLFTVMAAYSGSWISSVFLCALAFVLLCVSCIDIISREIPDVFVLSGAAAGILWIILSCFVPLGAPLWYDALLGALAGALPLFLIDRATILLLDKDAFGYGDMKLMAMAGLFLGWKLALVSLALAIIAGGIFSAVMLCSHRAEKGSYIAFGPFLSVGVLNALLAAGNLS